MKLNKSYLKQLIKEEIENLTEEDSIETLQSQIAADVEGMEYQEAMQHLKHMFRAMQNVMMDITPKADDSEMDMETSEEEMEMVSEEQVVAKMDSELKKALDKLSDKFDQLDLSIDFLTAVMSGGDVLGIGHQQRFGGRFASGPKAKK